LNITYKIFYLSLLAFILSGYSNTATAQRRKHNSEKKEAEKNAPDEKRPEVCNCVLMKIEAQDTLSDDAYITYVFTVKNRCKEPVWINSTKFGFTVNNFNGSHARVIRELQFVKRYTYPQFVSIAPGSQFEFKFADNPFDEYLLSRGNRYWFRFSYNNTNLRHPSGKSLNYLCRKELQRLVYIR